MVSFSYMLSSIYVALLALFGAYDADMRLDPAQGWPELNETFSVKVLVDADTPVNVFKGDIEFDADYLEINSIDYSDSVADLWTTEPWYSNGEGTLNFAGGTTKIGGFTGTDTVILINFTTKKVGSAKVKFSDIRILKHDGLGSDTTNPDPIDALFNIDNIKSETVTKKSGNDVDIFVIATANPTDINGDGKQTIADVSIFMSDLITQNKRSDLNGDGKVNLTDLSTLIEAK